MVCSVDDTEARRKRIGERCSVSQPFFKLFVSNLSNLSISISKLILYCSAYISINSNPLLEALHNILQKDATYICCNYQ